MDLLAAINDWDAKHDKQIAAHCGSEQVGLLQYHVLLENARKDIDDWPILDVHKSLIVGTIEALTAGNEGLPYTAPYVAHLKAAAHTLEIGALDLPAEQRESLIICLDLLIKKMGELLFLARVILE